MNELSPSTIRILFLVFFLTHFVLERVLSTLNVRHVLANRDRVPSMLEGAITPENHARGIEYACVRARFGHLDAILGAIFTLVYLFSGLIPWLDHQLVDLKELTHGVALIAVFAIIHSLLSLPLEWYETFHIEARFGFNKMTPGLFWVDKFKGLLLAGVIGVPFLYALLAFITQSGPLWWLWAALFVIGFQFLMILLYPLVIAPFFNKFTPLEDGELKARLEALADQCRFAARGIFVMDSSKRSGHSNAYFTGFGKARRIVLFDTLIQQLTPSELTAVLAHEIGHYKKKHIAKMLALSTMLTLAGFYLLSLLIHWPPMYQAFGITEPSISVGLLIFGLTAGSFTFWLGPLFHMLSRKHEYEADAYAAKETRDAPSMEGALLKLFEKNLSTLTPHPLYSAYHYSHPTLIERISALRGQS